MKASELIERLQSAIAKHGDLAICTIDSFEGVGDIESIDEELACPADAASDDGPRIALNVRIFGVASAPASAVNRSH